MSLSTHVLDAATGRPADDVGVRLEPRDSTGGTGWTLLARDRTDHDGRITGWATGPGVHRLVFDTRGGFFPEVAVTFQVTDPTRHHHVPLLLSPFAYSTYLGS